MDGLLFKSSGQAGHPTSGAASEEGAWLVAEVIILPGSELCGSTPQDAQVRQRYGLNLLSVNRSGHRIVKDFAHTHLREGDVLLVHGRAERVEALTRPGSRVRELGEATGSLVLPRGIRREGLFTAGVFLGALLCATTGWLPMSVAFLAVVRGEGGGLTIAFEGEMAVPVRRPAADHGPGWPAVISMPLFAWLR